MGLEGSKVGIGWGKHYLTNHLGESNDRPYVR
jgi:hypothetical protein